ncbi:MAG: DUF2480 family protein [Bacteroidia bacterium]|nr:DUF2480 family protein [Bacteroidia bacterium]
MEEIVNKVAQSGLISLDPEDYLKGKELAVLDMSVFLSDGILKEKNFREALQHFPFENFTNKYVCIKTPEDAIIPLWAYMLIASRAGTAAGLHFGDEQSLKEKIILEAFLHDLHNGKFNGQRVVLKGCGKEKLSPNIYLIFTKELVKVVQTLMFGEPCSTVPVYKRKSI